MINKYFQDKEQQETKTEKDRIYNLQRIANKMSKMVMDFWNNAGKVSLLLNLKILYT